MTQLPTTQLPTTRPTPEQAVGGPAGPAPVRPRNSIRRTTTIDMTWPAGPGTQLLLAGSGRDAVTLDPADDPLEVATARTWVGVGGMRTIEEIRAEPDHPGLVQLLGCRGGGYLRSAIDECLPGERELGSLLYLLLDDVSGTSLIANIAWSRHVKEWPPRMSSTGGPLPSMEGVCIGFAPGSSALVEFKDGPRLSRAQFVPSLVNDADPHGWHELADLPSVSSRRARRIDVWRDGDVIEIDSAFQDTAGDPNGQRAAVHEYGLQATVDAATLTLQRVHADPRVLPFMECPTAAATAQSVVGTPVVELRSTVLERLARTNGCTHLNDALRALAEVPLLLQELDRRVHA